jgi:hypothetical protein
MGVIKGGIKKLFLFILPLMALASVAQAGEVTLMWDAVIHPDLAGYRLYVSYVSGVYSPQMMKDVANVTTFTWTGLDSTKQNFFVATAYSIHGEESDYSNEVDIWGFPKVKVRVIP